MLQVHWLHVTIHAPAEIAQGFWNMWMADYFGPGIPSMGGYHYSGSIAGLCETRLYTGPANGEHHIGLVLPGKACECLPLPWYPALGEFLDNSGFPWQVRRIDIAFDDFPFTPRQVLQYSHEERLRSPMRDVAWHTNKHGATFELGSKAGSKFLRVYDMRGITRFEMQLRREFAHAQFKCLFEAFSLESFAMRARGLAELFMSVLAPNRRNTNVIYQAWLGRRVIWDEFIIKSARRVEFDAIMKYLVEQVSTALAVAQKLDDKAILKILYQGRKKLSTKKDPVTGQYSGRYAPLLQMVT